MKAILLILIIVIGGASYWKISEAEKKVKAAQATIEEAREMRAEASEAIAKLGQANARISALEETIAQRDQKIAQLTDYEAKWAAEKAQEEAKNAARLAAEESARSKSALNSAALQVRLAEMEKQYQLQRAALDQQKATLQVNLKKAKDYHKNLSENPPAFSELRNGENGPAGVRTSQADRERVIAKYQQDLAGVELQVTAIENEVIAIDKRFSELEAAYQAAVEKTQAAASLAE